MRIRCYIEPSLMDTLRTVKIPLANGTTYLTVVCTEQLTLDLDDPS
jgi:hypothetical protein